jgi:L-2-aminoadipate reductase
MPLNPNGKVDKPALPFPDTAQLASAQETRREGEGPSATPTEEAMLTIWARILPNAPSPIPLDENFFDLGGHSILATRLIFEIRKAFVVDAPLGLVFDKPNIKVLSAAIDSLRNLDLGFVDKAEDVPASAAANGTPAVPTRVEYGKDYEALLSKLQPSYQSVSADYTEHPLTVFLTGATGFLGAFILRDLLQNERRAKKVICLVRAKSDDTALERLRDATSGRGVWDEKWVETQRLEVVKGDLDLPQFGLDESTWGRVASEADAIIHNGALVHGIF